MKIEVGKEYELNNGDIVECTGTSEYGAKYGYGPFILGGTYYHEDGRFSSAGLDYSRSVKREHIEGKTLQELDVKAGDVVRFVRFVGCADRFGKYKSYIGTTSTVNDYGGTHMHSDGSQGWSSECKHKFELVLQKKPQPTLWRDMTDAEKGALLLAKFEGRDVDVWSDGLWCKTTPLFLDTYAYHIKPEPKIETVALCYRRDVGNVKNRIGTINLVDGTPDPASIKMAEV